MAKSVDNSVLDGALNIIKNNATAQVACSAEPANFAGVAAVTLSTATMTSTDFTVADGDTSGRKVTAGAKSGQTVSANGTVTHVALTNGTDTLYYVTTTTSKAVTTSDTLNFPAWDIEIADPA